MKILIDSFWRATVYCLHPRVMLLSLLPLVLIVAVTGGLGWLYLDAAVAGLRNWLDASSWLQVVWRWFEAVGLGGLKSVVAPLVVIFSVTPLVVSFFMTSALTRLVAQRRDYGRGFWAQQWRGLLRLVGRA
jgi:hypothetical protein